MSCDSDVLLNNNLHNPLRVLSLVIPPVVSRRPGLDIQSTYNSTTRQVQAFIYGGYVILFCQCMHIFRKRQLKCRSHKILLTGTILLFIICTLQAILGSISYDDSYTCGSVIFGPSNPYILVNVPINALYVFSNLIADLLFIYRCYIIWDFNKFVLWIPLSLAVINTVLGTVIGFHSTDTFGGAAKAGSQRIPLFLSLAMNVGLCVLSAGRIWWVSRQLKLLGLHVSQKYNTAIILIVESGAIYCIAIVGYLISLSVKFELFGLDWIHMQMFHKIFFGILVQTVGIIPTLIVVRIGLGVSAEDVQTAILTSRSQLDNIEEIQENNPRRASNESIIKPQFFRSHTPVNNV